MESITIMMPTKDADTVQKIFDEKENPGFSITKRQDYETNNSRVELTCDNPIVLWFLAKQVYLYVTHEEKMNEMIADIKKTLP